MISVRVLIYVWVLVVVCGVTGLSAESVDNESLMLSTTIQGPTRPLRSQQPGFSLPPAPCPLPPPYSLPSAPYSLPLAPYSLLTPEALNQPLTQRYIRDLSRPVGIRWINTIIRNGSVFFPFVRDEIARLGLPPEMIFLPFIESEYIPTARSRSGAMGIWQFMMNSIGTSMRVNDMVDERRDFRKSTTAALVKLNENYQALGCWYLALAAYNAGLGAVGRALQAGNTNSYWVLSERGRLRSETVHYVPRFLAVTYIMSKPRQFGVDWWVEPLEWTVIRPVRQASLDLLAAETGTDRALLHRLNAELLHGITPLDRNYELVVPLAQSPMFIAILEREDVRLIRYHRYRVQYGDTLSALSRHYGVSINLIEQHNPGITRRYLQIGEIITIPALRDTNPYTSGTTGTGAVFGGTHVVVQGDTLWSLAIRFGVSPQVLAAENGMELNQILSIGKVLNVPIIE